MLTNRLLFHLVGSSSAAIYPKPTHTIIRTYSPLRLVHTKRLRHRHHNKHYAMGMQPILPVTVPVKKIKGATHQCYGGGDGGIRCEQTFNINNRQRL